MDFVKSAFLAYNSNKQKKRFPEFPGFEPGHSDPIANHITTRPRSLYRFAGKNFAVFLISNIFYVIRVDSALGW